MMRKTLKGRGTIGPLNGEFVPVDYRIDVHLQRGMKSGTGSVRLPLSIGFDAMESNSLIMTLANGEPVKVFGTKYGFEEVFEFRTSGPIPGA